MTTSVETMRATRPAIDPWLEVTPGERVNIRTSGDETGGVYAMIEGVAEPGNGVPMHIHANEVEHFVVLEGTLHVANGDERLDVPAGKTVTIEKGVPHAWCNLADTPVRMLIIFSPGHIGEMFRRIASLDIDDLESIAASAAQFGTTIVGPTIVEGIYSVASPRHQPAIEVSGR